MINTESLERVWNNTSCIGNYNNCINNFSWNFNWNDC